MKTWLGLVQSLVVYWRPGRQAALRRLYAPMVSEGDLVFDIGAHLGDRSVAFAALGARVVALEPQPHVARWLRRIVGKNPRITVRAEAVGSEPGFARLAVSRRNPTVSTLSDDWRTKVSRANPGFRAVRWEDAVEVPIVTLDGLIEIYGVPGFCKIDVEGYEARVLAGLNHPLRGLSVEFVAGDLETSVACVEKIRTLAAYEFNAVSGEERNLMFDPWRSAEQMIEWLSDGAGGVTSGDLYARLTRLKSTRKS